MEPTAGISCGGLADSINTYGFAATIEASNTLNKKNKKLGQTKLVKDYLERITSPDSVIWAGVAFNGNKRDPPFTRGLNFIIEINRYNPEILESVAGSMAHSIYLADSEKSFLEKMLSKVSTRMPMASFLDTENVARCSSDLGVTAMGYRGGITSITGLCLEMYLQSYFAASIPKGLVILRQKIEYSATGHTDADDIIICDEGDFYNTLIDMDRTGDFTTWLI
jgi:hypothetical protein